MSGMRTYDVGSRLRPMLCSDSPEQVGMSWRKMIYDGRRNLRVAKRDPSHIFGIRCKASIAPPHASIVK